MNETLKLYGLYEYDFDAWLHEQILLLRNGQVEALDLTHLAEEMEGLAARNRREIRNRLRVLLMHLLKWHVQYPLRSVSWRLTINEQRRQLNDIFEESPSLRSYPGQVLAECYRQARDKAVEETGLLQPNFPDEPPFTLEQILTEDFWPQNV